MIGSRSFDLQFCTSNRPSNPAFNFAGLQEAVVEAPAHRVVAISHSEPRSSVNDEI